MKKISTVIITLSLMVSTYAFGKAVVRINFFRRKPIETNAEIKEPQNSSEDVFAEATPSPVAPPPKTAVNDVQIEKLPEAKSETQAESESALTDTQSAEGEEVREVSELDEDEDGENAEEESERDDRADEKKEEEDSERSWSGMVVVVKSLGEAKLAFIDEYWQEVKDFIFSGQEIQIEDESTNKSAILKITRDEPWQEYCKELEKLFYVDPCGRTEQHTGLILTSHLVWFNNLEAIVDVENIDPNSPLINLTFAEHK